MSARLAKLKGTSRLSGRKMIQEAMAKTHAAECWIVWDQESIEDLLAAAVQSRTWLSARRRQLGSLALLMKSPPLSSLAPAEAMFTRVIWAECWLPLSQLMKVLAAPNRRDLIIAGTVDPHSRTLTVYRGDFSQVTVPLSIFKPNPVAKPDFDRFAVGDYGHSVCFGDYEAAAGAIFYEGDPDYRKALKHRRREVDKTFGACLRRLRIQRRMRQADFAPLTARTIARIENNQVGKPRGKTLSIIARHLEVDPDAIETY